MPEAARIDRWWGEDPAEIFWLEVGARGADLGVDLNAPLTNERGGPFWSYDLVEEIRDGDVVLHYDRDEHAMPETVAYARMSAMRWVITLSATNEDTERLLAASIEDLVPHPTEAGEVFLELEDSSGDESTDETREAVRRDIELRVRQINGFGKLRWGRGFRGVAIKTVRSVDSTGVETQVVFVGTVYAHLQPRERADLIERMGHPRPALPEGLEVIEALDGDAVTKLAEANPTVGRVVHFVELMLEGDAEIDWVAAYSALEAVEHDLHSRGIDGRELGWWTRGERDTFKATSNSAEALGAAARHGKPGGVPEPRMSSEDASWYIRRVTAYWLTHLIEAES